MSKKILVIDDEKPVRNFLGSFLGKAGYEVVLASGGDEGIEIYGKTPQAFDLVITDLLMPDKDGIETIRSLKKLCSDVVIFAMSAGGVVSPENYLSIADRLGVLKTFQKPFSEDEVITAIKDTIGE